MGGLQEDTPPPSPPPAPAGSGMTMRRGAAARDRLCDDAMGVVSRSMLADMARPGRLRERDLYRSAI